MNHRQLAQVGLGILGVWALLTAVAEFVQIGAIVGASLSRIALAEVIPVGLLLGLSYLLIFHNARVATAIFPELDGGSKAVSFNVARTLVALTGVMLLVQASPGAVSTILSFFSVGGTNVILRGALIRRLIGYAVPVGSGIYLIARPGQFLEYLERAQPDPGW